MVFLVSRTDADLRTHNTLMLRRPKLAHISVLLRSNSGAVPIAGRAYTLHLEGSRTVRGRTDSDGLVACRDVLPGDYELELDGIEGRFSIPTLPTRLERREVRLAGALLFEETGEPGGELVGEEQADGDYGTQAEQDPRWQELEPLGEPEAGDA